MLHFWKDDLRLIEYFWCSNMAALCNLHPPKCALLPIHKNKKAPQTSGKTFYWSEIRCFHSSLLMQNFQINIKMKWWKWANQAFAEDMNTTYQPCVWCVASMAPLCHVFIFICKLFLDCDSPVDLLLSLFSFPARGSSDDPSLSSVVCHSPLSNLGHCRKGSTLSFSVGFQILRPGLYEVRVDEEVTDARVCSCGFLAVLYWNSRTCLKMRTIISQRNVSMYVWGALLTGAFRVWPRTTSAVSLPCD